MAKVSLLDEWAWLQRKIRDGLASQADKDRADWLFRTITAPAIQRAVNEAQRRAAPVEAGRRAGIAAGRRYLANHRQKR